MAVTTKEGIGAIGGAGIGGSFGGGGGYSGGYLHSGGGSFICRQGLASLLELSKENHEITKYKLFLM